MHELVAIKCRSICTKVPRGVKSVMEIASCNVEAGLCSVTSSRMQACRRRKVIVVAVVVVVQRHACMHRMHRSAGEF